jgi:ribosomal protein S12 methylthiotransferase accessory factor
MTHIATETTYIKGKDDSLENSIYRMQTLLKQGHFDIEEASWLNPVPNVYSVHIRDRRNPGLFTNGKGASRKATLASALGEFFERLETNYFFSDYYLTPGAKVGNWLYYPDEKAFELKDFRDCLSPELWNIYDSDRQLTAKDLLSFNDQENLIRALPLKKVGSGETVYFPMNLLSNIYASNGLAAGNTQTEAQVQGLSEVFERWVKNKILRENLCLPEVPDEIVADFPVVVEALEKLKTLGIDVSVRDASLGGRYPVMCVILFEQKSGRCFASFGAHPIFEVALERTLTESLQGRTLEQLDGFQAPVFDELAVADDENIENHFIDSSGLLHAHFISNNADFEFVAWDFEGDTQAQLDHLIKTVHQTGHHVYIAEYEHYDVPACRIIVPGMSEIYPFEELLYSNQNIGRQVRILMQTLAESTQEKMHFLEALEEFESLGLSDHQGMANLIGLQPDPDSDWKTLKVVDFRMWLYLAIKDYETALECVEDALYFVETQAQRTFYSCLQFMLNVKLQKLEKEFSLEVVAKLFGKETVQKSQSCIAGEVIFGGLPIGEAAFLESRNHQGLLRIYQQIAEVKTHPLKVQLC